MMPITCLFLVHLAVVKAYFWIMRFGLAGVYGLMQNSTFATQKRPLLNGHLWSQLMRVVSQLSTL